MHLNIFKVFLVGRRSFFLCPSPVFVLVYILVSLIAVSHAKPGWLKVCSGGQNYEVHAGGCSNGIVLKNPIEISCICVHGVWVLSKSACDDSPILLVGKGDCFSLDGASIQSMKFIGRPSSPFSPRSFLSSGSFSYFWKMSTETGAGIPKLKKVDIVSINSDKVIYSSRDSACCFRDDSVSSGPALPVHVCLGAPGNKYTLRSKCPRSTKHKDLNRISLNFGQGIQLGAGNESKILNASSECAECSKGDKKSEFETDCCQALPFEDVIDDSNVDPKRYEKQTNRLAGKYVDFVMKRRRHEWTVNTHEFNHLRHASFIVSELCPVPKNVLNTFVRFFRYLVNESISEWPLEKVVDDYMDGRIVQSLEECKTSIKDPWSLKRGSSCGGDVEAVVTPEKEIKIDGSSLDGQFPRFQQDSRDIVIETVWMLIKFIGSFCSKSFDANPTDLDYLLSGLQKLITSDLTKRWYNPGKSFEAIHFLLHDQDLLTFVRNLDSCTVAAEHFSTQKKSLTPPVIEEKPINKLETAPIWEDGATCLQSHALASFSCPAHAEILAHELGPEGASLFPNKKIDAQVYRVTALDADAFKALLALRQTEKKLDFWSISALNQSAEIMIMTADAPKILEILKQHKMEFTIEIPNVQNLLDDEKQRRKQNRERLNLRSGEVTFKEYMTFEDIYAWMEKIAADEPDSLSVSSIGKTIEGRDIKMLKFAKGGQTRPSVFIDAGIHAREWIAPATCIFTVNELLKLLSSKEESILDKLNFYIVPVLNVDGYAYSWTPDGRLWRKNRNPNGSQNGSKEGEGCTGVDANRNFGYKWGGEGASAEPCATDYRGPEAFSEAESQAVRDVIMGEKTNGVQWLAYLTIHSSAESLLTPWSYAEEVPADYDDMIKAGQDAADAIKSVHESVYLVGASAKLLGPTAGSSDDWAKSDEKDGGPGIKYSYTLELGPVYGGFIRPPESIIPTGEEIWAGFIKFFQHLAA